MGARAASIPLKALISVILFGDLQPKIADILDVELVVGPSGPIYYRGFDVSTPGAGMMPRQNIGTKIAISQNWF